MLYRFMLRIVAKTTLMPIRSILIFVTFSSLALSFAEGYKNPLKAFVFVFAIHLVFIVSSIYSLCLTFKRRMIRKQYLLAKHLLGILAIVSVVVFIFSGTFLAVSKLSISGFLSIVIPVIISFFALEKLLDADIYLKLGVIFDQRFKTTQMSNPGSFDTLNLSCNHRITNRQDSNTLIEKIIAAMFSHYIRQAQKSIGIVGYKFSADSNGMVLGRDLMSQPQAFTYIFAIPNESNEDLGSGAFVVINALEYLVIIKNADPREGSVTKSFNTTSDVVRYCTLLQIKTATQMTLPKATIPTPLDSVQSLTKHINLIQQNRQMLEGALERFLKSYSAKTIDIMIKYALKFYTVVRKID